MKRRKFLYLAGAGVAAVAAARLGFPYLLRPGEARPLSARARALVTRCLEGIDPARMWDAHVHVVGLGSGGTGCSINPEMQSHLHPIKRLQFDVYVQSLGMQDEATADADYIARLQALQAASFPKGRLILLPFDHFVDEQGREHADHSAFYTPNEYVWRVAREHDGFVAGASIHPYRTDAVDRLDTAVDNGAHLVKWLPNAMGIDPASPLCDPFYRRLAEHDLPLLSHGGTEYAVDSGEAQELGNPLRLRRALDAGVRVIVAHCASLGESQDLDAGSGTARSFDLLLRMLAEPAYAGRLYADISALTQLNRGTQALETILRAEHLHSALVNASDYPIPALRILYSTTFLRARGLLAGKHVGPIDEIAKSNPFLFDFVLKRCLRHTAKNGRTYRLANGVFETDHLFRRGTQSSGSSSSPAATSASRRLASGASAADT